MIIAEKLAKLRTKSGLSQEELAEKMNVSRQSVSKWESGASIPSLDKIIELSNLYGISTDYLLKDDIEDLPDEIIPDTYEKEMQREISLEEAQGYLSAIQSSAPVIALGVMLCILSPVIMLLNLAGIESGHLPLSENAAGGIGLAVLLSLIAIAVVLFIIHGMKLNAYSYLEKESFSLSYGVSGIVERSNQEFLPIFQRNLATGVGLCIVSVIPVSVAGAMELSDSILIAASALLLVLVACGVYLIVRSGIQKGAYSRLLQIGDYSVENKQRNKKLEVFSTAYWCSITAVYLAISFTRDNWERSWIIWPVAGVLYAALQAVLGQMLQNKN